MDLPINRRVVISGCSGGGKSTLLKELFKRGYSVVEEPGRRIIAEEEETGGKALPWCNIEAFARRAIDMSLVDIDEHSNPSCWIFFDRGLVDALSGLSHLTGESVASRLGASLTYHPTVFLTPPWPDIYVTDTERRHEISTAIEEYERLFSLYSSIGYEVIVLPKTSVEARADFVLQQLSQ